MREAGSHREHTEIISLLAHKHTLSPQLTRTGLGAAPPPKTDLHRFVKWPKYVRLQRQKRVLQLRLKVPPVVNQFMTKALDKNHAETLFKLMLKYRPEDKKQKRDRCVWVCWCGLACIAFSRQGVRAPSLSVCVAAQHSLRA